MFTALECQKEEVQPGSAAYTDIMTEVKRPKKKALMEETERRKRGK